MVRVNIEMSAISTTNWSWSIMISLSIVVEYPSRIVVKLISWIWLVVWGLVWQITVLKLRYDLKKIKKHCFFHFFCNKSSIRWLKDFAIISIFSKADNYCFNHYMCSIHWVDLLSGALTPLSIYGIVLIFCVWLNLKLIFPEPKHLANFLMQTNFVIGPTLCW